MELLFILIIVPVVIALVAAFFITKFARVKLVKSGNKYVTAISVLIFIGCSLFILSGIMALIIYNVKFHR